MKNTNEIEQQEISYQARFIKDNTARVAVLCTTDEDDSEIIYTPVNNTDEYAPDTVRAVVRVGITGYILPDTAEQTISEQTDFEITASTTGKKEKIESKAEKLLNDTLALAWLAIQKTKTRVKIGNKYLPVITTNPYFVATTDKYKTATNAIYPTEEK